MNKVIRSADLCCCDGHAEQSPCSLQLFPLRRGFWIIDVIQDPDPTCAGHDLAYKLQLFARQASHIGRYSSDISTRPSFAGDQPQMNRIRQCRRHNRNRRSGTFCCDSLTSGGCQDDVGFELDQLLCKRWQPLRVTISVTVNHIETAALDVTQLSHPLQEGIDKAQRGRTRAPAQPGNKWKPVRDLRSRRERPRGRRAADERDELPSSHVGHGGLLPCLMPTLDT